MTTAVKLGEWRGALDASRELMLTTIAGGEIVLTHATGTRMVAAWTAGPGAAGSRPPPRGGPCQGPAASGPAHDPRPGPRSHVGHDGGAVLPAHRGPAGAAHGPARRAPLHLHAAQGSSPRARPLPRSPESDRPVAHVAPPRRGAGTNRRLGSVDGDPAGRSAAPGPDGPRRVALANRPGRAASGSAGRRTHRRGARLATARRRGLASSSSAPPRGPFRAATPRRWTRRCRRRIRRLATPRPVVALTRPCGRWAIAARTRRSSTRASMASSARPSKSSATCWPSRGSWRRCSAPLDPSISLPYSKDRGNR